MFLEDPEQRRKWTMFVIAALALTQVPILTIKENAMSIADVVITGPITIGAVVAVLAIYILYLMWRR